MQPNTIVFQPSTPSTLAVPNLVGKTQAVAATKRAFLEVRFEDYVYFYVYAPSTTINDYATFQRQNRYFLIFFHIQEYNSLETAFSNCGTSEE